MCSPSWLAFEPLIRERVARLVSLRRRPVRPSRQGGARPSHRRAHGPRRVHHRQPAVGPARSHSRRGHRPRRRCRARLPAREPAGTDAAAHDRRHHARPHRCVAHRAHAGRTDRVSRRGVRIGSRSAWSSRVSGCGRGSASRRPAAHGRSTSTPRQTSRRSRSARSRSCSAVTCSPRNIPEALPSLLMEVIEVAQIRGTSPLPPACSASSSARSHSRAVGPTERGRGGRRRSPARPPRHWRRRLPPGRRRLRDADGRGVLARAAADDGSDARFRRPLDQSARARHSPHVPELDAFLDRFDASSDAEHEARAIETGHEAGASEAHHCQSTEPTAAATIADDDADETELSLDNLDSDSPAPLARDIEEIYDLPPLDEVMAKATCWLARCPRQRPLYLQGTRSDPRVERARAGCQPGCR